MTAAVFADPERLLIDGLMAAFAGRTESYVPAEVSTDFPTLPLTGDDTHVQVELEQGNSNDYPVTERAQVRVTCYAAPGHRDNVKDLASLTHALVLGLSGPSLAGVQPRVGRSSVTADPATKNLMVWFLVRADLKATPLAS